MKINIVQARKKLQSSLRRRCQIVVHKEFASKHPRKDEKTIGATSEDGTTFSLEKRNYIRGMDTMEICQLLDSIVNQKDTRNLSKVEQSSNSCQNRKESEHEAVIDDAFDQLTRDLLSEYCSRVRRQVREWLDKSSSWGHPEQVFVADNCRLATNHPEDIMYVIQMQMSVAREVLPPIHCHKVMILILKEVENLLNRFATQILRPSSEHDMFGIELMCAIISDCTCMYEQLDRIATGDFLCGSEAYLPSKLKKKMDKVLLNYVSLAVSICDKLARTIMRDMKPILKNIHTRSWIHGNQTEVIISTLRDYFQDIKIWIPPFFFAKFVRKCLETLRQMYVRSFFAKKYMTARRVNARTTSALLQRDQVNITHFFSTECLGELRQTGLNNEEDIKHRFEILSAMSKILNEGKSCVVLNEIKVLIDELGIRHGKKAIILLAKKTGARRYELNIWKYAVYQSLGTSFHEFHSEVKTRHNMFIRREKQPILS